MMSKILLAITTYNQSEYTKLCFDSLKNLEDDIDVLVIDDCSTDNTVKLCEKYGYEVLTKEKGLGLTDSWNKAYYEFKNRWFINESGVDDNYDYLIIANNDILIPRGAISELKSVFNKWPYSLVVPTSTHRGVGHNVDQAIEKYYDGINSDEPDDYQQTQDTILNIKKDLMKANNLYQVDPKRMKMFNGFFFMMNRNIINYQYSDTNLFEPKYIMTKNEDEFNWSNLIPNDDFPAVCKTSFVFHYKGVTTKGDLRNNEKWERARFGDE